MALTETTIVDQIEVTNSNVIQVREALTIKRDEEVISSTFHRYTLFPGDDVSNKDAKIQAIANAIWTEEVIAAYRASLSTPTI
jgi:hypothetical protein